MPLLRFSGSMLFPSVHLVLLWCTGCLVLCQGGAFGMDYLLSSPGLIRPRPEQDRSAKRVDHGQGVAWTLRMPDRSSKKKPSPNIAYEHGREPWHLPGTLLAMNSDSLGSVTPRHLNSAATR